METLFNKMKKTENTPTPAEAAGKVLIYHGSKDHDRFLEWVSQMSEKTEAFRDLFNKTFDEVLDSSTSFNKQLFVSFANGNWSSLESAIDSFVAKQNRAVKDYFRDYYDGKLEEIQAAWQEVQSVYVKRNDRPIDGKHFPPDLTDPRNLPFEDGKVLFDVEFIDSLADRFNEYLEHPDMIDFYNQMLTVAGAWNRMAAITKKLNIHLDMEPIGGFPFILKKDRHTGEYLPKSENLNLALTAKTK